MISPFYANSPSYITSLLLHNNHCYMCLSSRSGDVSYSFFRYHAVRFVELFYGYKNEITLDGRERNLKAKG